MRFQYSTLSLLIYEVKYVMLNHVNILLTRI